ncbi:hypothetical protein NQ318_018570 [Aromia moschata]|uniref:Uncharacterized protein n=1 Tax=Aromia moschata TaxID=1265417 RepID=A0AAV8ZGK6_9CUCU|nr:hypothetical protein NQ318_018570 [Aromia moschata]
MVALGFLEVVKVILDFLSEGNEIDLQKLNKVPLNFAELIFLTFEHCKNSGDVYKTTFNAELLEVFRIAQEAHLVFLKLFESCIAVSDSFNNVEEVKEINEVLCILAKMSEVLAEISMKCLIQNWKGYIAILVKFSCFLNDVFNLKDPVEKLTFIIKRNLNSLYDLEGDPKLFMQVLKIASFSVKLVIKIFDIFWDRLETVCQELVILCSIIHSYIVNISCSQKCLPEILELLENSICKPLEPFLLHLANDPVFIKVISAEVASSHGCPFGFIIFLNNILKLQIINEQRSVHFSVGLIVGAIFNNVKLCYPEFFLENQVMQQNVFDDFVLNITANVLIYDTSYMEVERILFENVLQENFLECFISIRSVVSDFAPLNLAFNSTPQLRFDTLLNLITKYEQIDFGTYTNRLEQVYMKCLMQRLFKMLPDHMKSEIIVRFHPARNIHIWTMMGFNSFPFQKEMVIESVCDFALELLEAMDRDNFSLKDLCTLAETLGVLSTAKFTELGSSSGKLVNAVCGLWEFTVTVDLCSNNVFKYFINKLSKITSAFMTHFSSQQLITILAQLKTLSCRDSYELLACEMLSSLSRRPAELTGDERKAIAYAGDRIYPDLLASRKSAIKQIALEVLDDFAVNGKHDAVKNIMRRATEMQMQTDVSHYLERKVTRGDIDRAYLTSLGELTFRHECVPWRQSEAMLPRAKKAKLNGQPPFIADPGNAKERQPERPEVVRVVVPESERKANGSSNRRDDSVTEVIDNIKGEVKCLVQVLKTEKLSRKNATDIRLIANQLLSLL